MLHGGSMYKRVLTAIDLSEEASHRALRAGAAQLAAGGEHYVVYVVEPQYLQYSMDPTLSGTMTHDLEAAATEAATRRLEDICADYEIAQKHVRFGRPAAEIHHLARELNAELIVVSSHGSRGWRRVLGSTANAVLHGTPVDTLVATTSLR